MEDYTNKRIDGRYEIQELIGVGGMACVYRAYDNIDDRIVAVKILKDEYLTNEDFRQRFKNESKVIAILSHPNIVKVYDVSYGDRLQYIVMEYVEGITLKEYIRQQGRLEHREVIHFTAQIMRALQHAHDKGIIHRDIKPQNIMLLANGTIKVTDFGIARFSTGITKSITESAIGSVHYISPEQARGETTDDKADIYSVGVMLYEMLTGTLPFQSENSVSVAMMQIQSDPKPPTQINADIPPGLEQMTLHAMRKNSKERYQSAAEMILDLEELRRNPAVEFDYSYSVDTAPTKYITTGKTPLKDLTPKADDGVKTANRTIPIIWGVSIAAVLIIVAVVIIFAVTVFGKKEVPDFLGMIYETQIKPELQGKFKDFVITVEKGTDISLTYVLPDQVYAQSLEKKSRVKKGSAITLHVNPGEGEDTGTVKIPNNLAGMTLTQARDALRDLNLLVKAVPQPGPEKDNGKVLRSEPKAGKEVKEGSYVEIFYVFFGEATAVPNLVNNTSPITVEEARYRLEAAGFLLDDVILRRDNAAPEGRVIAQSLTGKHPANSIIQITVSTGLAPQSDLTISLTLPDRNRLEGNFRVYIDNELVAGSRTTLTLNGGNASRTITGSGSNRKVVATINNWQAYSATVDFTSSPPKVTRLVVADPNTYPAYLPNVTGRREAEGTQMLKNSGFTSITVNTRSVSDPAEDGLIVDQSPQSGRTNAASSYHPFSVKITITVGRYSPAPTTPTPTTTPAPTTLPPTPPTTPPTTPAETTTEPLL